MKKFFLTLLVVCASTWAHADKTGQFSLRFDQENIPLETVTEHFDDWFSLDAGCTFEQVRDYTDKLGIRHTNFQQYYHGTEVEHCIVMVHSRNGIVTHANGCVMETEAQPANTTQRISKSKAVQKVYPDSTLQQPQPCNVLIVSVNTKEGTLFRPAYKIYDATKHADVYVDAETGEILKTISYIHNADVTGTGYTLYNGWQNFTCDYNESLGYYTLTDNARQILTIDARRANSDYLNVHSYATQAFLDYVGTCSQIGNPTTTWDVTALTSVTIISTPDDSWWSSLVDANPDLYIIVKDANNTVLYTSGIHEDCSLPVTFYVGNVIELKTANYVIEIWDDDGILDDYGGSVTITSTQAGNYEWSGSSTTGRLTIANGHPFLDAHWGMQETYDFYADVFGRNSYDDAGAEIIQFMFPQQDQDMFSTMPNNAFAGTYAQASGGLWPNFMAYGSGDGILDRPFVALDIMAHEFTHLVTDYNGNGGLEYSGESGALNESFSDIMGFSVENYVLGDTDYLIGEDVMIQVSNMRSMKDPKNSGSGASTDTYGGQYWVDPNDKNTDNGGVHTNSGVQNKWFYLLCEGGSGTNDNNDNYNMIGIGIEKGRQIAYRNLTTYLTPTATFSAARQGSLLAATDLYGDNSIEYQAVMNAWHAVGVGERYTQPSLPDEGKYVIVAQRSATDNYFYMTSDLGTASTKRYQAVSTGTPALSSVPARDLDDKYVWEVVHSGNGIKLKNGTQYSTWTSGNSANFNSVGQELSVTANDDGTYTLSFTQAANTVYTLALNSNASNNFFAYYKNSQQKNNLTLIPYSTTATQLGTTEKANTIKAFAAHHTIFVKLDEAAPVAVYDVFGRCVYKTTGQSYIETRVPQSGVYIIQVGAETRKVVVTD